MITFNEEFDGMFDNIVDEAVAWIVKSVKKPIEALYL